MSEVRLGSLLTCDETGSVIGSDRTGLGARAIGVEAKKQNIVKMFGKLLTRTFFLVVHVYR